MPRRPPRPPRGGTTPPPRPPPAPTTSVLARADGAPGDPSRQGRNAMGVPRVARPGARECCALGNKGAARGRVACDAAWDEEEKRRQCRPSPRCGSSSPACGVAWGCSAHRSTRAWQGSLGPPRASRRPGFAREGHPHGGPTRGAPRGGAAGVLAPGRAFSPAAQPQGQVAAIARASPALMPRRMPTGRAWAMRAMRALLFDAPRHWRDGAAQWMPWGMCRTCWSSAPGWPG